MAAENLLKAGMKLMIMQACKASPEQHKLEEGT
jgi:hypothetical protein